MSVFRRLFSAAARRVFARYTAGSVGIIGLLLIAGLVMGQPTAAAAGRQGDISQTPASSYPLHAYRTEAQSYAALNAAMEPQASIQNSNYAQPMTSQNAARVLRHRYQRTTAITQPRLSTGHLFSASVLNHQRPGPQVTASRP